MTASLRVLVIGGYGVFGGRLIELLEDEPALTLLVAGRSLDRARKFCCVRAHALAQLAATAFNRGSRIAEQLAALAPDIVVDASGPFQGYGPAGYELVEHCIRGCIHYLDMADGSDFVAGISRFDTAARNAGVFVLSGVSSFPVLTAAVVTELAKSLAKVTSIRGGIAPSPHAGVGRNVIRAITSYAGQPVSLRRGGVDKIGYPFTELIAFVIAVPGRIPLQRRRFSLVDVPDLRALLVRWPDAKDVWMGAGPVPMSLHWALVGFAWLVRLRLLPGLSWLASLMHVVTSHAQRGEDRGGMFVEVKGLTAQGEDVVRTWHLLAEGRDGPLIPSMAVEAVVRSTLLGESPLAGARPAICEVSLSQYERLFAQRSIHTGFREPIGAVSLYRRILGSAWDRLPEPIQCLHSVTSSASFAGRCDVQRGRHPLGRILAALIGFPLAGAGQSIVVRLTAEGDVERWVRTIGGRSFSSHQRAGNGAAAWLLSERFGAITVDMALVATDSGLGYVVRRWSAFGIPLPLWLGPRSSASESVEDGAFAFDVAISHPFIGLIVRYRGVLRSSAAARDAEPTPIQAS
ncbi:MAG: DUF4166 domain-containing protein [Pseudomonadota bacterium]|nr:DUF4166 domain-containing protein [Pseudomonadota bacterium]